MNTAFLLTAIGRTILLAATVSRMNSEAKTALGLSIDCQELDLYYTDGLRLVLFINDEPVPLREVELLE